MAVFIANQLQRIRKILLPLLLGQSKKNWNIMKMEAAVQPETMVKSYQ
jgi:hypothetical protein